jgi:transcriptional regulator with XRE-family HTH domain
MSTETDDPELSDPGIPELTALGKRIELLRFERRLSKRILAQRAGTSRQQLWRVMTGKSELTSSLCARLSDVLEIDSRSLRGATSRSPSAPPVEQARYASEPLAHSTRASSRSYHAIPDSDVRVCETLEEYVSGANGLARTFETFPLTDDGRRLKRVLLDAIEDIAIARSLKLPQAIFDLRRAVVNDDA